MQPEISLGSTGAGIGLSKMLARRQELRFEYDFIDFGGYQPKTTANDTLTPAGGGAPASINLQFNDVFHTQTMSVLYDRYFGGPFYVAGGIAYNFNRLDATSIPGASTITFNGTTQNGGAFGAIKVHVRWQPIVPYLGVGWKKHSHDRARTLRVELGAFFQGSRKISVETSGIVAANPAIFGPYVAAFTAKVPGYVPTLNLYPVVRVSIPVGK